MNIKKYYERGHRLHAVKSDDKKVKTAGYIPRRQRIEALLDAGNRLVEYRERTYMYKNDSLAEQDSCMPEDIWQDEIEHEDSKRAFETEIANRPKTANKDGSEKEEESANNVSGSPTTSAPSTESVED